MAEEETVEVETEDVEVGVKTEEDEVGASSESSSEDEHHGEAAALDDDGEFPSEAEDDEDPIIIDVVGLDDDEDDEVPEIEETEVDRLTAEVASLREGYLRKLAEFDNFRKRTEREKSDFKKSAGETIVRELVPVLDNFERALQHASDTDPDAFRLGVEMIGKQLWEVLERQGLERLDPEGEPFQPEFHEAIQRVEDSDHPPGTVAWVLAKGYVFGGRLLRPAMVGVAVERSEPDTIENSTVEHESEGDTQ